MLITCAILLPILLGALVPFFRFKTVRARGLYVEAVVLATSALVAAALLRPAGETVSLFRLYDGLTLTLHIDGMTRVFAGLVALLWPLASLYGFEYMKHEERPDSFFAFYTMSYGITLGVAASGNLFSMYIFYECLTLMTLPLVFHKKDSASIRAGRMYLYYSIGGAALGFIALMISLYYGETADFRFGGVFDAARAQEIPMLLRAVYVLAFFGFGTKAAVFPLYAWLPTASVAPTPVTALLHAVAVVNAGAFAVLRLTYDVFGTELLIGSWAQTVVLAASCFTIVFASSMAVKEQHLKRRLAYSTVSNLSYMLMGCCLMTADGMTGSLAHLVIHGVIKITLFYCAGAILVKTGQEYVQDIRGLAKVMPFTSAVFTLASVALVGTPPLAGFVSKWNLLTAASEVQTPMGIVAVASLIVSAILTAIYLMGVALPMYFRPTSAPIALAEGKTADPNWMMKLPFALLCAAIVALGLWSQPLIGFLRGISAGLMP